MHGCTKTAAVMCAALLLAGCQDPAGDDAALLLGQREQMLQEAARSEGAPADPEAREREAYQAVQDYVDSPPPRPRPGPGESSPDRVTSMGPARLPQQRHAAATSQPPPRPSSPVVEWVSVTPVQQDQLDDGQRPGTAANVPSSMHAAPGRPGATPSSVLERAVRADPNDVSRQLKLRYLYLSEGRPDKALTLPQGMDPQRASQVMTWMRMAADAEALIDTAAVAPDVAQRFEELAAMVRAKAELHISRVEMCSSIQSYGRYEIVPADFFVAGANNRVYVYCEVRNFASQQTADGFQAHVAHRLELLDRNGEVVWQDPDFLEVEDVCRNRRTDFFFNRFWQLPPALPAGDYVLNVIVEDKLKSRRTEAKKSLVIRLP